MNPLFPALRTLFPAPLALPVRADKPAANGEDMPDAADAERTP